MREKGLPEPGFSGKEEISLLSVEVLEIAPALLQHQLLHIGSLAHGEFRHLARRAVIVEGKAIEILPLDARRESPLATKSRNDFLPKAAAFFPVDKAGVPAGLTAVGRAQIIDRITGAPKNFKLFCLECGELFF